MKKESEKAIIKWIQKEMKNGMTGIPLARIISRLEAESKSNTMNNIEWEDSKMI